MNGSLGVLYHYSYEGSPVNASTNTIDPQKGSLVFDTTNGVLYRKTSVQGDNTGYQVVVDATNTVTLTNKTLTSPVITNPTITGTTTGGVITGDRLALATAFDVDSGTSGSTLTSLAGISWTVGASAQYIFRMVIPHVTMTTNCGLKMAFKLTTATLASVNLRVRSSTDTDNTGAVSTNFTSTTDQATWMAQNAVVYTNIEVLGSFITTLAGTIAVQAAQNAAHADNTTIDVGAIFELYRTA